MNECIDLVIYDRWSYMAMLGVPELMVTALPEGILIDRLLFAEARKEQAILQENCPLTVYVQNILGMLPVESLPSRTSGSNDRVERSI